MPRLKFHQRRMEEYVPKIHEEIQYITII